MRATRILCLTLGTACLASVPFGQERSNQFYFATLSDDAKIPYLQRQCATFAAKLGFNLRVIDILPKKEVLRTPTGMRTKWTVHAGELLFFLDNQRGDVLSFFDLNTASRSRNTSRNFPVSKAEVETLWIQCETALQAMGARGLIRSRVHETIDQAGLSKRLPGLTFHFEQRAHGFDSNGNGNYATLTIDRTTRRFSEIITVRDWKYDPPKIRLDRKSAIAKARVLLGSPRGTASCVLSFTKPITPYLTEDVRTFAQEKRCRLAYTVKIGSASIAIDAELGVSLGIFRSTSND